MIEGRASTETRSRKTRNILQHSRVALCSGNLENGVGCDGESQRLECPREQSHSWAASLEDG